MIIKTIVIISNSSILFDTINDNYEKSSYKIILSNENWLELFLILDKLDILIIDKQIDFRLIPYYKICNIINLTSQNFSKEEFKLKKPYKLWDLLNFIDQNQNISLLFCTINNNLVYDERLACLKTETQKIKLTEKENQILKLLIKSHNHSISKKYLMQNVWKYHENSESSTINVHLYKLKQKLPSDLLQVKYDCCMLNVFSIR